MTVDKNAIEINLFQSNKCIKLILIIIILLITQSHSQPTKLNILTSMQQTN